MTTVNLIPHLSNEFKCLYEEPFNTDVTIQVGEEGHSKIFHAHWLILCVRSSYFKRELSYDKDDSQENSPRDCSIPHVIEPIKPETFEKLLRYIYTGIFTIEDDINSNLEIVEGAKTLELNRLMETMQSKLIKEKKETIHHRFVRVSRFASQHKEFEILNDFCKETIENSPEIIFAAADFSDIDNETLVELLNRDIDLPEGKIWEHVLRWGVAKKPGLEFDSWNDLEWSHAHGEFVKDILKDCVPLVRFFHMDNDEYIEKVVPLLHLLPYQLWVDLIRYKQTFGAYKPKSEILPPRKRVSTSKDAGTTSDSSASTSYPTRAIDSQSESSKPQPESRRPQTSLGINIDSPPPQAKTKDASQNVSSLILNNAQIQWLLSMTKGMTCKELKLKESLLTSFTCTLNLLYRGSHDGDEASVFHNLCDNKGPTITVIRTKEENEIIGGYNPISWNQALQKYMHTSYSFLFAMKSSGNVLSLCKSPAIAIRNDPNCGPVFGNDLVLINNFSVPYNHTYQDAYDKSIRGNRNMFFSVEEIEVFQVIF
ncbi:9265_t:CDS:2 [Paraglomus occultum]|uniref:9265_t:CDS:1 n=1 Tax=Paraglomus occultum TaxID=144539 RepID=A0A9N9C9B8_9GLOM|nr:9265_t:CDS:2 [Paraglomus occultum]